MDTTPKTVYPTKRLGLSRRIGRTPIASTSTPTSSLINLSVQTPDSTDTSSKPNDDTVTRKMSEISNSENDENPSMTSPANVTVEVPRSGNNPPTKQSPATKVTAKTTNSGRKKLRSTKSATATNSHATKVPARTPISRSKENPSMKSAPTKATFETPKFQNAERLVIKSTAEATTKLTADTPNSRSEEGNLATKSNFNETPVSSKPNKNAYKLSLCKTTTEAMTRKRIIHQQSKSLMQPKRLKLESLKPDERHTAEVENSVKRETSCDNRSADECIRTSGENEPSSSHSSLQNEVDELRNEVATMEKHEQRTSELRSLITKWRAAGLKTIDELKEKMQLEGEEILAHHHIDPGLFELNVPD